MTQQTYPTPSLSTTSSIYTQTPLQTSLSLLHFLSSISIQTNLLDPSNGLLASTDMWKDDDGLALQLVEALVESKVKVRAGGQEERSNDCSSWSSLGRTSLVSSLLSSPLHIPPSYVTNNTSSARSSPRSTNTSA